MNTPQDSSHRPSARGPAQGSSGGTQASGTRDRAEELADKARAEGQEQAQHYRDRAADKVDTFADSVKAAAAQMQDDDVAHLSGHISDMADGLGRMADGLREKSADEILHDVRRIARENPTLFIAGSIAVGFGITRFARASASAATDRDRRPSYRATGERPGDTRWTDPDASVPGTTAQPATGNATIDTTSPGGLTGAIPAAPGPSATSADAISARAGAAASDGTASGARDAPSSDIQRGSHQP
ncbi:hypothetical protein [Frateuria sp. STR12]|uniref:hypothetical protein n=1 Tax=Frateuria hangzhouensis TaxID=2995589 RepID=UPI002260CADA|nr:hypothetical protein [Frateuria sp. STR12]MCX7515132.1 hypothetical protein [Frateuria sp. STR12]